MRHYVITSFRGKVFSQEGHYFGYRIIGRVGVPLDVPSHAYGGGIHIVYVRPITIETIEAPGYSTVIN